MLRASIGLIGALHASAVLAHHGNSEFDLRVTARYEGVVVEHVWINPHTITKIRTRTESGEPITLEIEGSSPSILRTAGLSAESIVEGETVTAVVSPSRRFPKESAYGYELIRQDGTVIPLVSARIRRPAVTQTAADLFTTWLPSPELFAQITQGMRTWGLTEKGQEIRARYSPVMSPQVDCIPVSAPMLMAYPVAVQLQLFPDHVAIKSDWMGAERTVYLDGRARPSPTERFPQGFSVGRWEGAVLVVDTTNFDDQVMGGMPSGQGKHLEERFALAEDRRSAAYSFVWSDPEYLAEPVSGTGRMDLRPDLELGDLDCDRELSRRFFREFE